MAAVAKRRLPRDPTRGNPFLNVALWVLVAGLLGLAYGLRDPAVGIWPYGFFGAAVGIAIASYSQRSDSPFAEVLRMPQGLLMLVRTILGGPK
jgi:hypothetical protein